MDLAKIEREAREQIRALGTRHLTASYLAVAITLLGLLAVGWWVSRAMSSHEAALAKADERFARYQQEMRAQQQAWLQHEKERNAAAAKQQAIETRVAGRNAKARARIAQVAAPGRTSAQVASDAAEYLGSAPAIEGDRLAFTTPQVQRFLALQIDRDRCLADLRDAADNLALEKQKTANLEADLAGAKDRLTEAEQVIDGYKRVAKKTRLRKFFGAAKTAGIVVVAVLVGRASK